VGIDRRGVILFPNHAPSESTELNDMACGSGDGSTDVETLGGTLPRTPSSGDIGVSRRFGNVSSRRGFASSSGESCSMIAGGRGSASGECGGDRGSSGRSSRKRDIVLLGTLLLSLRVKAAEIGGAGTWFADIESREVLENEDGPELRFDLLPHRNRFVHDRRGLAGPELPSETFLSESDTSVLAGSDG